VEGRRAFSIKKTKITTDMKPLVSIITPSFNQGKYIKETIESVLNQNYSSVEYIVVDGRSTDNTLDILKKYNTKIKWLSEQDRGQAEAINKGIQLTAGEIIAWLNSDDTFLPGAIKNVIDCFLKHPKVKMVYGKSNFIDTAGKIVGRYPTEPFDYRRLAVSNFICQPSAFFKRHAFFDVGGLNPQLHYSLDYDLWIRITKNFQVKYIAQFLSNYRLHKTSKTVAYNHALFSHKEGLDTALKHFNWAPANRVYGYCYHLIEHSSPKFLRKFRPLTLALSLPLSIIKYLQLNKGIRYSDIKGLNPKVLKKLFIRWDDFYKYY
jgi:glycosyltransferase involved in cell wall biosynthesis